VSDDVEQGVPEAAPGTGGVALAEAPDAASQPLPEGRADATAAPEGDVAGTSERMSAFSVHLDNFEGPFDLLLGLISKHKLDVTEVALSQVTDEFIAYIRARGDEWDLGQATEFLVVASTLLDLKTARLLPSAEIEDEEDLALLEARDILFARLLQYRAYKDVSAEFARRMADESRRFPRAVGPDPRFANLLPEVLLGLGPAEFAALAARAMTPRIPPTVGVHHIHAPRVSVQEQGAILVERLRRVHNATFRSLTADCPDTLTVVARFLALLELFRDGVVAFEQMSALGELHIRWTASDEVDEITISDEFDEGDAPADDDGADAGPAPAQAVTDADLTPEALAASAHTHDPHHHEEQE
jgi:segregation and condensation protein A